MDESSPRSLEGGVRSLLVEMPFYTTLFLPSALMWMHGISRTAFVSLMMLPNKTSPDDGQSDHA
jgi:hypothetical protein